MVNPGTLNLEIKRIVVVESARFWANIIIILHIFGQSPTPSMPQTLVGCAKFRNKLSARDNPPILHRCKPSSSAVSRFPHLCFNPKPSPTPAIFSQILPVPSANLTWTVSINNRTHIVMQRHPTSNHILSINQVGWHYTVYSYDLDDVFMTWFMDFIWLYIYIIYMVC